MKGIGIIVILIAVVLVLGIGYIVVSSSSDQFETPIKSTGDNGATDPLSINGVWGQDITIVYKDGSEVSLKNEVDNPLKLFSVKRDDKEIDLIRYTISAKASGSGVDNVDIDISDFAASFKVYKPGPSGPFSDLVNTVDASASGIATIDLDDSWHEIWTVDKDVDDVVIPSLDSYIYQIQLLPSGTLKFKDVDNQWTDVNLPNGVVFSVIKTDDAWISIEFSSGYSTN